MNSLAFALPAALAVAALAGPGAASVPGDALDALEGRWVWTKDREELGLKEACRRRFEEYDISDDRRAVTYRIAVREAGSPSTGVYRVLYVDGASVGLFLEGEDRRFDNGDPYIWIAVVDSLERFVWRVHGTLPDPADTDLSRVRCPS